MTSTTSAWAGMARPYVRSRSVVKRLRDRLSAAALEMLPDHCGLVDAEDHEVAGLAAGERGVHGLKLVDDDLRGLGPPIRAHGRLNPVVHPLGRLSAGPARSEEHTSELQSRVDLVCR